ncbi:MAG: hypothetical protein ACTJHW_03970 [Paenalcaligenes sp.]
MNKNYGERWHKLLAEIDIYSSDIRASLYMYNGSEIQVDVGCDLVPPPAHHSKRFHTSPTGLADARKWVVEKKRGIAEQIRTSNHTHQRAETVQKQVGPSNASTAT